MLRWIPGLLLVIACGLGDAKSERAGEVAPQRVEAQPSAVEPKSKPNFEVEPDVSDEVPVVASVQPPLLGYSESLGGLKLGMTAAELLAIDPELTTDDKIRQVTPNSRTPGPDTYYSQTYRGGKLCEWAELRGPTAQSVLRVAEMSTGASSSAKTVRGLTAGSTQRAMKKAYPGASEPIPGEFWVRISDHEMLTILVAGGEVSGLYLGAPQRVEDIEE